MTSLEINTVNRIRKVLETRGAKSIKVLGDARMSGEPDILACFPIRINGNSYIGITVAIECKQKSKKPTTQQIQMLRRWERAGAIAFWSSDPEEVLQIIENEIKVRMRGDGMTTLVNFRPSVKETETV